MADDQNDGDDRAVAPEDAAVAPDASNPGVVNATQTDEPAADVDGDEPEAADADVDGDQQADADEPLILDVEAEEGSSSADVDVDTTADTANGDEDVERPSADDV